MFEQGVVDIAQCSAVGIRRHRDMQVARREGFLQIRAFAGPARLDARPGDRLRRVEAPAELLQQGTSAIAGRLRLCRERHRLPGQQAERRAQAEVRGDGRGSRHVAAMLRRRASRRP